MIESKKMYNMGLILLGIMFALKGIIDLKVMQLTFPEFAWHTTFFVVVGSIIGSYMIKASYEQRNRIWLGVYIFCGSLLLLTGKRFIDIFSIVRFRPCIGLVIAAIYLYSSLLNENTSESKLKRYLLLISTLYLFEMSGAYFDVRLCFPITIMVLMIFSYHKNPSFYKKVDLYATLYICCIPIITEILVFYYGIKYHFSNYFLLQRYKTFWESGFWGVGSNTFREEVSYSADEIPAFIIEEFGWLGALILSVMLVALLVYVYLVFKNVKDKYFEKLLLAGIFTHWISAILLAVLTNLFSPSTAPLLYFAQYNFEIVLFLMEFFMIFSILRKNGGW